MLIAYQKVVRPHVLTRRGRRLYFQGTKPEYISSVMFREKLEKALPQYKGASLYTLVTEYELSGAAFYDRHIVFAYYEP